MPPNTFEPSSIMNSVDALVSFDNHEKRAIFLNNFNGGLFPSNSQSSSAASASSTSATSTVDNHCSSDSVNVISIASTADEASKEMSLVSSSTLHSLLAAHGSGMAFDRFGGLLPQSTQLDYVPEDVHQLPSHALQTASHTSTIAWKEFLRMPLAAAMHVDLPTSAEEIAKEAMRITKESLQKSRQSDSQFMSPGSSPPQQPSTRVQQAKQTEQPSSPKQKRQLQPLLPAGVFPDTSKMARLSAPLPSQPTLPHSRQAQGCNPGSPRLNKFVRRLHDMLSATRRPGPHQEELKAMVEWPRRGLLVLHDTRAFAARVLPQYFRTRNFKTFRRQLNYYGFVHVRSFSSTTTAVDTATPVGTTTAIWVHQELAAHSQTANEKSDDADTAAILSLKRVEPPCDAQKTAEGRRSRKEKAMHTVEEDLGVTTKALQMQHITRSLLTSSRNNASLAQKAITPNVALQSSHRATSAVARSVAAMAPVPLTTALTNAPKGSSMPQFFSKTSVSTTRSTTSGQEPTPMEVTQADTATSTAFEEDRTGAANLLLLLSKAS